MRYGMVINTKHCVGCQACTIACLHKNGNPPGQYYSKVLISESGIYPNVKINFQPVLCNHCTTAPCLTDCPVEGATYVDDNGIVLVDSEKCIGCGSCVLNCPYEARVLTSGMTGYFPEQGLTPYEEAMQSVQVEGIVGKCDFCKDLLAQGQMPACVHTCVGNARVFGDLDDPESDVSKLVAGGSAIVLQPELGTEPNVYYL